MLQVPSKTPALYKRLAQLNHAALFQTGRVLDLNTIMENAAELTASDFAVLLLTDESRCRVHAAAAVGLNGGAERFSSLVDEGILDRFRNRLNVGPAVQLTATPVLEPAGLAGILIAGKSLYFTEEEIWTMSVLAEFAAVAIRSRRLHDIETGEIAQIRKSSLESLKSSEQTFQLALKVSNSGLWEWDVKNDSLRWSDEHFTLLGLTPGQIKPSYKSWLDRVYPDDLSLVKSALEQGAKSRREFGMQYRVVWPNGSLHWLESRGRFVYGTDGKPERVLGLVYDITELKRSESRLKHLARIVANALDAIYTHDETGNITSWNSAAEKLFGFTAGEIIGRPLDEIVPSAKLSELRDIRKRVLSGEKISSFETIRRRRSGANLDVSLTMSPIFDDSGAVIEIASIARDISPSTREREKRAKSHELTERAFESCADGITILDADGHLLQMNTAARDLFGIAEDQKTAGTVWSDLWSATDRDRALQAFEAARSEPEARFNAGIVEKAGRTRWAEVVLNSVRGTAGRIDAFVATSRDVTTHKLTDDSLFQTKEKLRTALDSAHMSAFAWDFRPGNSANTGTVEHSSGRFELLGADDLLTSMHDEDRRAFFKRIEAAVATAGKFEFEYKCRAEGNGFRWRRDIGEVVFDQAGRPSRLSGVSADITEIKQAATALRESAEHYRRIVESAASGIAVLDAAGAVVYFSPNFSKNLGLAPEALQGTSLFDHCIAEERAEVESRFRACLQGAAQTFPLQLRSSAGSARRLQAVFNAMPSPNSSERRVVSVFSDNSENHELLTSALNSERRLRAAISQTGLAIWELEPETGRLNLNRRLGELVGRSPEEQFDTLDALMDCVHVDDREYLSTAIRDACDMRRDLEMQFRVVLPHGGTRWILGKGIIYGSGPEPARLICISMDVTDRKRVEEGLEELLDREQRLAIQLRKLVETSGEIQADQPVNDLLRRVGQRAREIVGCHQAFVTIIRDDWTTEASLSSKYESLDPATVRPYKKGISSFVTKINESVRLNHDELLSHPAWRGRLHEEANRPTMNGFLAAPLVGRDGVNFGLIQLSEKLEGGFNADDENILVQLAYVTSGALENLRLFEETQREIAERELAEQERNSLLIREKEAREAAEQASHIKDEFLATISHELRTPLTAILGWSRILQTDFHDVQTLVHGLSTIERNAKSQSQLIEDLLDVSRIISGKIRFESKLMHLPPVINAAIDVVMPAAEAKQIKLNAEFDESVETILGDPARVQQIIWNLLVNSVKFTPQGGSIEVRLDRRDANAVISVKDTGAGINPEFLPYVFDRFRQADRTTTKVHGGLGLGLAIVRHMVELHGGTVSACSPGEGLGATFTVTFPIPALEVAPQTEAPHSGIGQLLTRRTELSGLKIHVVDDEPDTVEVLKLTLSHFGADVTASGSAEEAIRALRKETPDILISDIGMPEQDGYELIRTVRNMNGDGTEPIPAIALTAYAASEDKRRALLAGFQTHIPKPIEPMTLVTAIKRLTSNRGRALSSASSVSELEHT